MKALALKALIVVTSHSQMGNTGKVTGYYLPEVSHPYAALVAKGIEVDIASPLGGKAPLDPTSLDLKDPINKKFYEEVSTKSKLDRTLALESINPKDYAAIVYAGGHGTMWDFPTNSAIQRVTAEIFENGGVVAAVCHGPAALVNVKLSNGKYLVDGKKVGAFSNAEEEAAGLTRVMPFLLETELKKRGASYSKADLWKSHVVVDGKLVTGQNPASAGAVGEAVAKLLTE